MVCGWGGGRGGRKVARQRKAMVCEGGMGGSMSVAGLFVGLEVDKYHRRGRPMRIRPRILPSLLPCCSRLRVSLAPPAQAVHT